LKFEIVVCFRSGSYRGRLDLTLTSIDPDVTVLSEITVPVLFEGDDERASYVYGNVQLEVKQEGLHWMIVKLGQEEQTRIPFRVVYQRQPTVTAGG
jgi:hypothetical protein